MPGGTGRWAYAARQAAWALVDLIFPPACGGCGKEGQRFCVACRSVLSYLSARLCPLCGYPLPAESAHICGVCSRHPLLSLAGLRSAAFFEGPLQSALHRLKYRRDILLADSLARLLGEAWERHAIPGSLVVPVPLSPARLRERGYNQAGLLARGFAELAGLRYAEAGLARVRHTRSQVGLAAQARAVNVAGAFEARPRRVAGQAVIVVDDVCTTGATLEACARALRTAGAASVWGLTVARAR